MQVYVFTILFKKLKNIAQFLQKEKKKREKEMDTDNSVMGVRRGGWVEMKEGIGGYMVMEKDKVKWRKKIKNKNIK